VRSLGVDPGLNGALALWDSDDRVLRVWDAPVLEIKVGRSARRKIYQDAAYAFIIEQAAPDRVVLEEVHGIKGQSASASFNFGAGFGLVRGVAAALKIPLTLVSTARWRARLLVPPGKDGSRARASQLFPANAQAFARAKDDGRAEAALISLFTSP
jgi:crossover junction endodeoxyribonuclease RuvC